MTLLNEQVVRIRDILQEPSTQATVIEQIIAAHQESLQDLARQNAFSTILWINTIAGQNQYPLPAPTVHIDHVLYNESALRYTKEHTLDRTRPGWEILSGEPIYWLMDNQAPNVIRLVPTPIRTGNTTPHFPPVPLLFDMEDNLVIFLTEDVATTVENEADVLPTLLDWDDFLVWRSAKMLAQRETETQNLPVVRLLEQLEAFHGSRLRI